MSLARLWATSAIALSATSGCGGDDFDDLFEPLGVVADCYPVFESKWMATELWPLDAGKPVPAVRCKAPGDCAAGPSLELGARFRLHLQFSPEEAGEELSLESTDSEVLSVTSVMDRRAAACEFVVVEAEVIAQNEGSAAIVVRRDGAEVGRLTRRVAAPASIEVLIVPADAAVQENASDDSSGVTLEAIARDAEGERLVAGMGRYQWQVNALGLSIQPTDSTHRVQVLGATSGTAIPVTVSRADLEATVELDVP